MIADVGDVATYTDKTAVSGKTYIYTVRCLSGDEKSFISSFDAKGLTITYIAAPVLKTATSGTSGVTVTWEKSAGATKYRVFRKEGSGGWKKIADVGDVATYTDKTAVSGSTYTYTVRCLSDDGNSYISSYDAKGLTITYMLRQITVA